MNGILCSFADLKKTFFTQAKSSSAKPSPNFTKAKSYLLLPFFMMVFGFTRGTALAIPFKGSQIIVTSPSRYATDVGVKIAQQGGNYIDVAVSVALALSVTGPYFASLGGGGFALVKNNSQVEALDFRETAPQKTHADFYEALSKDASLRGGKAVGVPGIPAGLWALHQKYGKLPWKSLFSEPIKMAQSGFRVSGEWVEYTESMKNHFDAGGVKHFLKPEKSVYKPGEIMIQKALAKALTLYRDQNIKGFYSGSVAKDIVNSIKKNNGVMELEDLSRYKVRWLTPLVETFKEYKIYLMPPPSSGGVVIQSALHLVKQLELEKYDPFSINEFHLLGEILSRSFKGRALLGDPDFTKNPIEQLLSKSYLEALAKSITLKRTTDSEGVGPVIKESEETTHLAVMDQAGNSVSMTITLNGNYGSGVVSEQFGIALNNEMDDFTTRPKEPNLYGLIQGKANLVEAGKRPLSSMSPTIVTKGDQTILALGAPGGPRIISGVFQVLYRTLVRGLDMDQAIQAPRVHHQFRPHRLFIDQGRFTPETLHGLREKGHQIEEVKGIAKVYGIKRHPETTVLEGAFDSRGEGFASGY